MVVSGIGGLIHITGPKVHRTRTLDILGIENLVPRVLSLHERGTERGLGTSLSRRTNRKFEDVGNKVGGEGAKKKKRKKEIYNVTLPELEPRLESE